jgi:Fe-S cluster assembly protein SufD
MNAEIKPIKTAAEQAIAAQYDAAKSHLPGGPDISRLRDAAFRSFAEAGLPNRRVEEWKYTDLRTILREALPLVAPADTKAFAAVRQSDPLRDAELRKVVFLNGVFAPQLSDLDGLECKLTVLPLAKALAEKHPLAKNLAAQKTETDNPAFSLNTAFLNDGALIEVGEGGTTERPIHIRHVFTGNTAASVYARNLCVVRNGAQADLIETYEGPDGVAYQSNYALELRIGDKARASLVRLQTEGDAALHLSSLSIDLGAGSELQLGGLTVGAAVSRLTGYLRFSGQHSSAQLSGAILQRGRQHGDTTLVLDHAIPHCTSRETFRTVLDDAARGIVQGRIIVRPDAQKTDARMSLGALLLTEGAEADQKPELEIFADDVQCAHGATSGAIDKQLLFYLMARGIPQKEAEALLVRAFFGQALDQIASESVREVLTARAVAWLAERS